MKEYPYISYNEEKLDIPEYIEKIKIEGFYAGDLELKIASDAFKINILVLENKEKYKAYIQNHKIINEESYKPILILE